MLIRESILFNYFINLFINFFFLTDQLDGKVYRRFGVSEEGVWVQQDDDVSYGVELIMELVFIS